MQMYARLNMFADHNIFVNLQPLSHQTAMPKRSKNLSARCGVAAKYV